MSWIEDAGAEMFNGLNLTALNIDQAYLRMNSSLPDSWLYSLSNDCHNCPYTKVAKFDHPNKVITLEVIQQEYWRVLSKDVGKHVSQNQISDVLCEVTPELGEFGVYRLQAGNDFCDFSVEKEPVNIYLPILILFFIILGLTVVWKCISPIVIRKFFATESSQENEDGNKVAVKKRVRSLDTFRGLSVVLTIIENDNAGKYWWMEHATWNGLTLGDLMFPCFLWIMGVCIPMSVKSIITKDLCKKTALWNIFRRSCTLFLLGLIYVSMWGPYLDNLRIFGVLQRFGICYWVVASLAVITGKKREEPQGKWGKMFRDITELGVQWVIMLLILLLHLLILFLVPAPGCPTGYMGAGGKQNNHANEHCIGGITKHIDIAVLGDSHLYQNPTTKRVYESGSFDPEGIFGCLLSIVHVFFGLQAGNTLQHFKKWKPLLSRWLLWAAATGLIGGILCNFSKEDGVIPVNKNLWSLSFVLVTTCFAFTILSVFYLLIDVLQWWSGSPFLEPGMNAITMFVGPNICYSRFPFHWRVPHMRTHFVLLMEGAWSTMLWILVSFEMARNKIFVTV